MAKRGSDEWKENIRRSRLADPSLGYAAIHHTIRRHRTGACTNCGKVGWTDMAYKHHPRPYTREPTDYHELCRSCHKTLYPQPILSDNPHAVYMRVWRTRRR